ncbi:hypothetical protein C8J27_11912, partial [Rhodobacter aestuarii]
LSPHRLRIDTDQDAGPALRDRMILQRPQHRVSPAGRIMPGARISSSRPNAWAPEGCRIGVIDINLSPRSLQLSHAAWRPLPAHLPVHSGALFSDARPHVQPAHRQNPGRASSVSEPAHRDDRCWIRSPLPLSFAARASENPVLPSREYAFARSSQTYPDVLEASVLTVTCPPEVPSI